MIVDLRKKKIKIVLMFHTLFVYPHTVINSPVHVQDVYYTETSLFRSFREMAVVEF